MCLFETSIYVSLEGRDDSPVVFGQLTKRDGSFLIGRKSEPNFNFSNLSGKEIIMGRKGGVPAMTLEYVLNNHGYTDGVNIDMNYRVDFANIGPAFVSGIGDYVAMFEPAASEIVKQGAGYIVASIGAASGEVPYTCYMTTQSYLKKNNAKLTKFLECINKATMYLLSNSNDHLADLLLPFFVGTDKSMIIAALSNYRANDTWVTNPAMKEASYNNLINIMKNAGELTANVPFGNIVDNTIANKI